jgi:methyl-accepting chemotaxis protein
MQNMQAKAARAAAAVKGHGLFGFIKNLRVSKKIYGGFAAVLLLLVFLAAMSFYTVRSIGHEFEEYGEMASDAMLIADLEGEMFKLQLKIRDFLIDNTDESRDHVRETFAELGKLIAEAKTAIQNPERAKLVAQIDEAEEHYRKGFEQVVELVAKRNKLVNDNLNPLGAELRKTLTEINQSAYADGDYQTANYAGVAQEQLLLARLYVVKFLDTNQEDEMERARAEFADLEKELKILDDSLENPERRRLLAKLEEDLPKYRETAEELVATIHERNKIREEVLEQDGKKIREIATEIEKSAEHDEDKIREEVAAQVSADEIESIGVALVALCVGALMAFWIGRGISGPVNGLTAVMGRLADKDWSVEVPARDRGDEIGEMARAVQVFKENGMEISRLEAEQANQKQRAEEEKRKLLSQLANDFQASVGAVCETLAGSAQELQALANQMVHAVEETNSSAQAVAAASEQAAANVQTVASSAEEMASSIREISQQVAHSTQITGHAVQEVAQTNARVEQLAQAADRIGEIVRMITDIASKTNLLALNATIEAARAGEAGKGFAVVASEVKTLANQTAKATEEIGGQVAAIQGSTGEAVTAMRSIGSTIAKVNEIAQSIAAAVEEQTAATGEIARNTQEASTGTKQVTSNISSVTDTAKNTGQAAQHVLQASGDLAKQAERLRQEVAAFVSKVRAA